MTLSIVKFFRAVFSRTLYRIFLFFIRHPKAIYLILGLFVGSMLLTLSSAKFYQNYADRDPDRGAIAMNGIGDNPTGALGEKYSTPIYLRQGWDAADSLWFYNTTQGSGLLPYDFFLVLEEAGSDKNYLRSAENMDRFRYLPQKRTTFNPDGLPVGFVKDSYRSAKWYQFFKPSKDYVGFTCAACHTGQLNYTKPGSDIATAIRIDGGPAMSDMVGFLKALEVALYAVTEPGEKKSQFVQAVLELGNDYSSAESVITDLEKWYGNIKAYNYINSSDVGYGHARLDAFGRIYNRILKYVISTDQAKELLATTVNGTGDPILTGQQMGMLFKDIEDNVILGDENFAKIQDRLESLKLSPSDMLALRNQVFNEANAPVSYPFLWDIVHSTYVQWNGVANNYSLGPLGRNVGEVIGVFGILDWRVAESTWWRPSTWTLRSAISKFVTGQSSKKKYVTFDSSVDVTNLRRLERKLKSLLSPEWPRIKDYGDEFFKSNFGKAWELKMARAQRGKLIYDQYCAECHAVIERDNLDRLIVSKMMNIDLVGTDPLMARNSVGYQGASGNFADVYQSVDRVGDVVIEAKATVIQMLTAAATGVITTPDRDKWFFRRWADWVYNLGASLIDNPIKDSVKAGNYRPDTMSGPYNSLLSYKARSLNGIWATAPYLHNGSVPTLYDLLLPSDCENTPDGECRPESFYVGAREFDPSKVGLKYEGLDESSGFSEFDTSRPGNSNVGHEYGAGGTVQMDGETKFEALSRTQRWELIEFLKTL